VKRIDSHQHFWSLSRGDYAWLTPDLAALYRDYGPSDLAPFLAAHGICGTVLVQAAQTDAETQFLLDVAGATHWVKGVVGWVDMAAPDAPERIARLSRQAALKGLRPMLQDMDDDDFILRGDVQPALVAMADCGLRLDALVRPRHLPRLTALRRRFADLPIVIDHAAKPDIAGGALARWRADLMAVAADGLTCCKVSGLVTEAGAGWTVEALRPVVDTILEVFGPDRVMWGSDWPVVTLAVGYGEWVATTEILLSGLDAAGRSAVLGGTAIRFYGLEV